MMNIMKEMKTLTLLAFVLLAGCSSSASRMAECQAQGISRNTCYLAEQNRQAAILGASQAQAYKNASEANDESGNKHHHHARQYGQAGHKNHIYKRYGVAFRMSSKNFAYLNDSLCAIDEDNTDATTYQSGLYNVIVYHRTGKVALMRQGQFQGYLK